MASDRLIPQDLAAEQSVIGSILQDPEAKLLLMGKLQPAMFRDMRHQDIYTAILACDTPDVVTVSGELEKRHKLASSGGSAYLTECVLAVPSAVYVEHYAEAVIQTHHLRRLLEFQAGIPELIYRGAADSVDALWSKVRAGLDDIQPDGSDRNVLALAESVDMALEMQGQRAANAYLTDVEARRIKLPWPDLAFVGELEAGSVTVFSAESSVGKTALAETCAEFWAEQGLRVAFVHLEISHQAMVDRRTQRQAGISRNVLKSGKLSPFQLTEFHAALDRISKWAGNLTYIHAAGWTASRIVSELEKMHRRQPMDVAIIDYLTMIEFEPNVGGENTAQATARQVKIIKTFAERLGIPVVLVSQVTEGEDGLNNLRNSREIFQKANVVLEVRRELLSSGTPGSLRSNVGKVVVKKNTFGETGIAQLAFIPDRILWWNAARRGG